MLVVIFSKLLADNYRYMPTTMCFKHADNYTLQKCRQLYVAQSVCKFNSLKCQQRNVSTMLTNINSENVNNHIFQNVSSNSLQFYKLLAHLIYEIDSNSIFNHVSSYNVQKRPHQGIFGRCPHQRIYGRKETITMNPLILKSFL